VGTARTTPRHAHAAIARRGAQAVIPPRKNPQRWKATLLGALLRKEALQACHRLGHSMGTFAQTDEKSHRFLDIQSLLQNSFVHPCKEEFHLVFKLKKHV
jgi:hypothetical protein